MCCERLLEREEAACQASPVDRHYKPNRGPLFYRCGVVGARNVVLNFVVEHPLFVRHRDEFVVDATVGNWGRQLAFFEVLPKQLARVPRNQLADRRIRTHQRDCRSTIGVLKLSARDIGYVPQCTEDSIRG